MLTILAFIVTIGVIVTIHEYGHFQVARWCGVKVLRFSIGFGKPLWRKTIGADKTEFVLAAIPFGGYVKMLDENELKAEREHGEASTQQFDYKEADLERAFNRQSVYKRIAIVLAGPVANLLLAIAIYWILLMQGVVGMRPIIGEVEAASVAAKADLVTGETIQSIDGKRVATWSDVSWILLEATFENKVILVKTLSENNKIHQHKLDLTGLSQDADVDILKKVGLNMYRPTVLPIIEEVLPNGAAKAAGLMAGDRITRIDGMPVQTWSTVVNVVKANPEKTLHVEIKRKQDLMNVIVTPHAVTENNAKVGKIGAAVKVDEAQLDNVLIKQKFSMLDSLGMAIEKTWKTSAFSLKMMWYMVTGQTSWKGISGPVTIASYAGESAGLGLAAFMSFIALISISIGVLNLLPIPVLDGGHLMYYMAEIIKGSAVSEQTMLIGQKIGIGLLGLLMMLAIFNDFNRIVAG